MSNAAAVGLVPRAAAASVGKNAIHRNLFGILTPDFCLLSPDDIPRRMLELRPEEKHAYGYNQRFGRCDSGGIAALLHRRRSGNSELPRLRYKNPRRARHVRRSHFPAVARPPAQAERTRRAKG